MACHIDRKAAVLVLSLYATIFHPTMAFQRAGYLARQAIFRSGSRRRPLVDAPSTFLTNLFAADRVKEEVDPGVVEGTNLRIIKYPNPALRAPNEDVTQEELKDGSIAKLAKEMFLVM